jgi:antirestriction protein
MTTTATTTARVYVGTYEKYNNGSIEGQWLDLDDYADRDDFYAACQELHGPGEHEFMFQDFEGIPDGMVSESHIDAEVWDWLAMDDDDKELLAVYRDHVDRDGTLEQAQDAYQGRASTAEDAVEQIFSECYTIPRELESYIDWSRVVRDWECDGYTFARHDGEIFVFRSV